MTLTVAQLDKELVFIVDSQDVEAVKQHVRDSDEYDSFFVRVGEGEYLEVWGMEGIIPLFHKSVRKIL